ncbi:hypothetical protein KUTeg_014310 [Tegillarca granosa]|uniref:BEACH domain-containing protein n=1 Tax=Tegillarca granosa TaxID=220873 RepID=A0ABQ9EYQ4_TEGGR|nr:hypothetical protein KUTeg_014310 [Tegillarca granosa]
MDEFASVLRIPNENVRYLSATRCVCLVTEEWLQNILQTVGSSITLKPSLSVSECERLLSPSTSKLPSLWIRISVKIIKHSDRETDRPFCNSLVIQFMEVFKDYLQRLHPKVMFSLGRQKNHKMESSEDTVSTDFIPNVAPVLTVIESNKDLYLIQPYIPHCLYDIVSYSPTIFNTSHAKPLFILYQILHAMSKFHVKGLGVGKLNFHSILLDEKLWVYLSNPDVSIFECGHETVPSNGECDSELMNKNIQNAKAVEKSSVDMSRKGSQNGSLDAHYKSNKNYDFLEDARTFLNSCQYCKYETKDLPDLTEDWIHRKITNFKYLMILNHLAGRRFGDPNHHPVIPWVMDFSSPNNGFRDLSVSKFRLNKGDNQLDLTYESFLDVTDSSHVPHHVTDFLSDITYYVYKARRTPKSILCLHVRSKWVPNEYPTSMQRMQEWTPDECIPEFFTDPTIFTSIHEDLPDLELPPWTKNAEDFVRKHMDVLESEELSGSAAVKAKNVNFYLVDDHRHITNTGVTQIFKEPHPHRLDPEQSSFRPQRIPKNMLHSQMELLCSTDNPDSGNFQMIQSAFKMLGDTVEETGFSGDKRLVNSNFGVGIQRPENATIRLPKSYNPTADLDQLESLYSFSSKTYKGLPSSTTIQSSPSLNDEVKLLVSEDMVSFGCLMCEMFMSPYLNTHHCKNTLQQRYYSICKACVENRASLPRPIQRAAKSLLKLTANLPKKDQVDKCVFEYSTVNKDGLPPPTPFQLLLPHVDILPFPEYFPDLYQCLSDLKQKDSEVRDIEWKCTKNLIEKSKLIKILSREKVSFLQRFLELYQGRLEEEGLTLILPYVEELFENKDTSVQAAWSLFSLIAQEIGPQETNKKFTPFLVKLFNVENPTPKHMKLYSKSFIIQLLLRLGLKTFFSHFSTLLVEAVSGFKNYVFEDFIEQQDRVSLQEYQNDTSQNKKYLPVLQEENVKDDVSESQDSDFSNISSDLRREPELTESTQDDVDDIDEESISDLPYTEDETDPDQVSNKSRSSASNKSEEDDEVGSYGDNKSSNEGEEDDISSERASIHSISRLAGFPTTDSADDTETPVWNERQDTLTETEGLQFEEQNDDDISEQDDVSSTMEPNQLTSESKTCSNSSPQNMVRSETDEFAQSVSEKTASEVVNIHDVAAESIKWLSKHLGPLLCAKYLSRNLVRMLALCYLGDEQLLSIGDPDKKLPKTSRLVCGDKNAHKILECLACIAQLYGEQVLLLQYIPCIVDICLTIPDYVPILPTCIIDYCAHVNLGQKRLTQRAESGLIGSLVLLRHVIPLLSDKTLMDILKDTVIGEILTPVIKLVSSSSYNFPGGSTVRTVICHKLIDVIYIIGLRIGFEMTRNEMTRLMKDFFYCFNQIHGSQLQQQMSDPGTPQKNFKFQILLMHVSFFLAMLACLQYRRKLSFPDMKVNVDIQLQGFYDEDMLQVFYDEELLQGFYDEELLQGFYDEELLQGFYDEEVLQGFYDEELLQGFYDEELLQGFYDEELLQGFYDEEMLQGFYDEEMLQGFYDEELLQGFYDEELLQVFYDEEMLQGFYDEEMLQGFYDEELLQGFYDKELLQGFYDEELLQGFYDEELLQGFYDEELLQGFYDEELLQGFYDEELLQGFYDEEMLQGFYDEELLQGFYDEELLQGFYDEELLQGFYDEELLQGFYDEELLQGFYDEELLQGFYDEELLQGFYDEELLQGFYDEELLQGFYDEELLQGFYDEELLQGFYDEEMLQGFSNKELLQGFYDELLQGFYDEELLQGFYDEELLQVFYDEEMLQGFYDEELLQGFYDEEMLQGFYDEELLQGFYDEELLQGFYDEELLQGFYDEELLQGFYDEELLQGFYDEELLQGFYDEELLQGFYDEEMLQGFYDEELLQGFYDEELLQGFYDEELLQGFYDEELLQVFYDEEMLQGFYDEELLQGFYDEELLQGFYDEEMLQVFYDEEM